jgi:hypothetical protein
MLKVFAFVTDAFGGRGGVAQYNRDLLGALAGSGTVSVRVLPWLAPDPAATPPGISQDRPRLRKRCLAVRRTLAQRCCHITGPAFLEAMTNGTLAIGLAVAGDKDALADGELGVLVSESNLTAVLMRALERDKPKPYDLAAATRALRPRALCRLRP